VRYVSLQRKNGGEQCIAWDEKYEGKAYDRAGRSDVSDGNEKDYNCCCDKDQNKR